MYFIYGLLASLLFWWLGGATPTLLSAFICAVVAFSWILWILAWGPLIPALHTADITITPRLLTLLNLGRTLQFGNAFLGAWAFTSFLIALLPFTKQALPVWVYNASFCFWLLFTGLLLEWLTRKYSKTAELLDPFNALTRIEQETGKLKGSSSDVPVCRWTEVVEEVASRSLDRDATALASASIQTLTTITEGYLQNNSARLNPSAPEESQHATRYVLHTILDKYAALHARAEKKGHHGMSEQILAGCGRIAITAAEKNPNLASEPIELIGQLGLEEIQTEPRNLGLKTTRLLMQLSKRIASHKHLGGVSVEKPFLILLYSLEKLAKGAFRKDKETPIALLVEPFKEINTLFKEGIYSSYLGAEAIAQKSQQVIDDFTNLELVLRTLPKITAETSETSENLEEATSSIKEEELIKGLQRMEKDTINKEKEEE